MRERLQTVQDAPPDMPNCSISVYNLCPVLVQASTVQPYGDEQRASKKLKSEKKSAQATLDTDAVEASLSLTEVFRRLRALDQPVTLFGEVRSGTDAT
jgi:hypothetical protein